MFHITMISTKRRRNGEHSKQYFPMHFLRWIWPKYIYLTISGHWFRRWLSAAHNTSHCLNQWWYKSKLHQCVTRPQSVNISFGQIHIIKWEVTLNGKLIKHNHDRHKASPVCTEYHCHIPSIITRTYAALLDTLADGQHARLTNCAFLGVHS